jgi:hypothetical protein
MYRVIEGIYRKGKIIVPIPIVFSSQREMAKKIFLKRGSLSKPFI